MVILTQESCLLVAQLDVNTTTQTLPEPVRYVAYMALLGIALLGMLIIVVTLLGGHWVRRLGSNIRRSAVPSDVIIPRKQQHAATKLPHNDMGKTDGLGTDDTVAS